MPGLFALPLPSAVTLCKGEGGKLSFRLGFVAPRSVCARDAEGGTTEEETRKLDRDISSSGLEGNGKGRRGGGELAGGRSSCQICEVVRRQHSRYASPVAVGEIAEVLLQVISGC